MGNLYFKERIKRLSTCHTTTHTQDTTTIHTTVDIMTLHTTVDITAHTTAHTTMTQSLTPLLTMSVHMLLQSREPLSLTPHQEPSSHTTQSMIQPTGDPDTSITHLTDTHTTHHTDIIHHTTDTT